MKKRVKNSIYKIDRSILKIYNTNVIEQQRTFFNVRPLKLISKVRARCSPAKCQVRNLCGNSWRNFYIIGIAEQFPII